MGLVSSFLRGRKGAIKGSSKCSCTAGQEECAVVWMERSGPCNSQLGGTQVKSGFVISL